MKEDNTEEFTIKIYAYDGSVNQYGYSSWNKGSVCVDYGNVFRSLRGNSKLLARTVVLDLENCLRKNSGVKLIKFVFPDGKKSVPLTMDGYFGRPLLYVGADFIKPFPERRRTAFSKEINKISNIIDKRGNLIKLVT